MELLNCRVLEPSLEFSGKKDRIIAYFSVEIKKTDGNTLELNFDLASQPHFAMNTMKWYVGGTFFTGGKISKRKAIDIRSFLLNEIDTFTTLIEQDYEDLLSAFKNPHIKIN